MRIKNIGSNQTSVVSKLPSGGTIEVLFSYETPVAVRGPTRTYKTERKWSVTTSKHINKFLPADQSRVEIVPQDDLDQWELRVWE
jgi:hypothetical protein